MRFQLKHVLQEKEGEGGGSGVEEEGEGEGGEDPKTPSISLEVIPEELRGKSEVEIKYLLSHMADSTAQGADRIRTLQLQLDQIEEQVNTPPPKEPDPDDEISDEELISSNPEKAVLRIMERTGIVDRFSKVETQVGDSVLAQVATEFDDFEDHREQIESVLNETGVARTRNNIVGAYTMSLGLAEIKKKAESRKVQNSLDTVPPTGSGEIVEPRVLVGLEADIFESSGMDRAEWDRLSGDDAELAIEVPR